MDEVYATVRGYRQVSECDVTYDLNVDAGKLTEVGGNVAGQDEHDPVVRELTE